MVKTEDVIASRTPKPKYPVLNPITKRFSPRYFSLEPVKTEHIQSMLEAARLTPSASNVQPWYFYWMKKESRSYEKLITAVPERHFWIKSAPLLILATYDNSDVRYGKYALYDLGAAVISLVLQAQELGYYARQCGNFDHDITKQILSIEPKQIPFTIIAVGKIGDYQKADSKIIEMDLHPTERKIDIGKELL
jgi:nitroreductase